MVDHSTPKGLAAGLAKKICSTVFKSAGISLYDPILTRACRLLQAEMVERAL